jgi:hypothetical protein
MTNLYMRGWQGKGIHELLKSRPADAPSRFPRNGTYAKFLSSHFLNDIRHALYHGR